MSKSGIIGSIIIGLVIILSLIGFGMCSVKVPAGYVAVQYNMSGGVKDDVLSQGWHMISPTTHTTLYTVGIEQSYLTASSQGDSKEDESFSASSSEGKAMQLELTFTYQYQADNVVSVFNRFKGQSGKEVRDGFIKPNIVSWTKEVVARYKVSDILGEQRANVNVALTDYLSNRFGEYGISISNVSLINIEVDEKTQEAINAKITAQQDAETQSINNQTAIEKAEAEAKVKVTQAEADADAELVKAEKEAQAILVKAEAEANANKMISESLTPELLEKYKYEQWNGSLPKVTTSNSSGVLVDVGEVVND